MPNENLYNLTFGIAWHSEKNRPLLFMLWDFQRTGLWIIMLKDLVCVLGRWKSCGTVIWKYHLRYPGVRVGSFAYRSSSLARYHHANGERGLWAFWAPGKTFSEWWIQNTLPTLKHGVKFVYHYPRTILHSFLFVIFFFMQKSCGQFVNVSDLYYVVCYLVKHAVSEWRLA